jgi:hypothetical protein
MAIRIPILTSFDPKGLKAANTAFAGLQSSMGSLTRNFAAAGAVVAGAFTVIGKGLADAAESQKVLAQTEAVLRSTGTTANGTATQIAEMASSLQKSTAFSDEAILSGANLLLTFKNIQNQAGEGNDIFDQTTQAMLDVARAMGTDASGEAIRLGKALNDPVGGISALTRVGIQFTDQQKEQIEALQTSGDLMGAQKIILAELQSQFGGSAAAYAQTFAGQVEGLNNDLNDLSEEIGFMVMPAVQGMIEEFRTLIPIIGPQIKAAIESVDWAGLVKSVVDFTKFLIENAGTIAKTIGVLWALSTIVKTVSVVIGIGKVAVALYTWAMAQLTAGTALATTATNLLSTAMKLLPWVAVATGLALTVDYFNRTKTAIENTYPALGEFETNSLAAADTASRFTPYLTVFRLIAIEVMKATGVLDDFNAAAQAPKDVESRNRRHALRESNRRAGLIGSGALVLPDFQQMIDSATSGGSTLNDELDKLNKEAERLAAEAAKAMEQIAADEALAIQQIEAEAQAAREAAAAAEQAILDKRLNAFESFNNSVKNLFGQIKDSILSSFNLPSLGNSVNSITRNISKLLERTKSFASNISQLSGMGLNSSLLQQVIQAGPLAGSALAQALVGGGSGFIGQLNQSYGEFGDLASGIAGVGTRSAFDNPTIANTYNIEVNGGVGSGPTIGKAIVDAIKSYERTSGAVWQGA